MPYYTALNVGMYGGARILAQYNYWQRIKTFWMLLCWLWMQVPPRISKFSLPRRGLYGIIVIKWSMNPNVKHQPKFGVWPANPRRLQGSNDSISTKETAPWIWLGCTSPWSLQNKCGWSNKCGRLICVGVVICDYRGSVLMAKSKDMAGSYEVEITEALAVKEGVLLARERGLH